MDVWYVSYGSNLCKSRFSCYIKGGTPEGSDKAERGCLNQTPPKRTEIAELPYSLYFMREKSKWGKGGVAFIDHEKEDQQTTIARKYLITDDQFREVVEQENNVEKLHLPLEKIIDNGYIDLTPSWYDRVLYVGETEGAPMFTFTNSSPMGENDFTTPPSTYLSMISRGLKEVGLKKEEIVDYFIGKPGIENHFTRESLYQYIFQEQTSLV
ncbi:hypothetical protein [Virgibacillus sp. YIM 98842]|uniref:hypothetical protein n=1 Tax=Virgibacillus sp. YIM 98842 TaxID=2663533 RepID=UPI0013D93C6B|nr:hypothetical protein [Virgibacillus sp. YIM 98842]